MFIFRDCGNCTEEKSENKFDVTESVEVWSNRNKAILHDNKVRKVHYTYISRMIFFLTTISVFACSFHGLVSLVEGSSWLC